MKLSPEFEARVRPFLLQGILTDGDVYPVALVAPRFGERDAEVLLGLAFAVRAPRVGHTAVDLGRIRAQVDDERRLHEREADEAPVGDEGDPCWPEPDAWCAKVLGSTMVGDAAQAETPFARQLVSRGSADGRTLLMTRRMFREQQRVAQALVERARTALPSDRVVADLEGRLRELFGDEVHGEAAEAVRLAASQPLAVIIGGPGTGKTYSVSRLLAALVSSGADALGTKVVLAAPTGKAAARMREALREATAADAVPTLPIGADVRTRLASLPSETLHRLVGVRPDGSCRHHRDNPIPADVVVVDEVSMVDLANMRRLLEAVPPTSRLVLLGDRDQLASVEAGCVLADVVDGATRGALLGAVRSFTVSRRFAGAPDIGLVAACLQSYETAHVDVPKGPDADGARRGLAVRVMVGEAHASKERVQPGGGDGAHRRIEHLGEAHADPQGQSRPSEGHLAALARPYLEGFSLYRDGDGAEGPGYETTPVPGYAAVLRAHLRRGRGTSGGLETPAVQREILLAFERYRVLAVHRRGALGVSGLERALAARVRDYLHGGGTEASRFWVGRPILITENAYDVKLMNGDVGVVLPTRDGLAAVFLSEDEGGVRAVATSRLPPHEGALAMTVHKSQGSQFDRVALVLAGRPSPIQTRELIYTGVTRAKNQLAWLGGREELAQALEVRVARASGLTELLG